MGIVDRLSSDIAASAYHESGHAIARHVLGCRIASIEIFKQPTATQFGQTTGLTRVLIPRDHGNPRMTAICWGHSPSIVSLVVGSTTKPRTSAMPMRHSG